MSKPISWRRVIASYVPPRSLTRRTRAALSGLGYRIVPAATRGRFDDDSWEPDIRIIDERHLDRVPAEPYLPRIPIVVLTGSRPLSCHDPRVVGSLPRPARLERLYPILQSALEDQPRSTAMSSGTTPRSFCLAGRKNGLRQLDSSSVNRPW